MQRLFELTIREKGGAILHPSYMGDVGEDAEKFLTCFFGLDKPDVESYEIREEHLDNDSLNQKAKEL